MDALYHSAPQNGIMTAKRLLYIGFYAILSPASPETEKYGRIIDRKNTDGFSLCGAKALLF